MNFRHQTSATPLSSGSRMFWIGAQIIVFVLTLVVIAGLFFLPQPTLDILWFILIPVLPLTFMLNAGMWRDICPLATANMLMSSRPSRDLTESWISWSASIGILLLFVLVPARRFLFNMDGPILAIVVLAVTALAFTMGWFVKAKGGFCNSICPVLPVEKLYGQAPLFAVRNARCVPCTHCTAKGCQDLDPVLSVRQSVGNGGGVKDWIRTPFGVFAAAFPGFIFGYFQLSDGVLSDFLTVYGTILGYAAVSLVGFAVLSLALRIPSHRLLPVLGGLAVGIYYWYAAPASLAAFDLAGGEVLKWVMTAFVAFWLSRALRHATPLPTPHKHGTARAVTPTFPLPQAPR